MSDPAITFTAAQWNEFMTAFGNLCMGFVLLAWAMSVRWLHLWDAVEFRVRRRRRRLRQSAIRDRKAPTLAQLLKDPAVAGVIPDTGEGRA